MGRKKNIASVYRQVEIMDAGAEGKAVAKVGDLVIFLPYGAPGDVVDIQVTRKKKSFAEGQIVSFHHRSGKRSEPFCAHFGLCGGCKWQHLEYPWQLFYKQKQVEDNFIRLGKLDLPSVQPIIPSDCTTHYRNKLEFTFSNRKWLTENDISANNQDRDMNALGFHIPGMFDRVVDINTCYLQAEPSNEIRLAVRSFALENKMSFYDVKKWVGFLRNLIIRNTINGEVMVILVFREDDTTAIQALMESLAGRFPGITSLMYTINQKRNDVINDLDIRLFKGTPYITETMQAFDSGKELQFRIGPVSFFQTNTRQSLKLYRIAAEYAGLKGNETVYDLYTGTGTIANFIAGSTSAVIGIEYVPAAISDAQENARLNGITNTRFFAGDIAAVMNTGFIEAQGKPDVVITDPPRSGMHEKVVRQILSMLPEKVVYISCNPATQARDIALMNEAYSIQKVQPVDMFPHTHHVENVVLLARK
jgi:23S rRNA (uracil1939-C5)-methyltransferase